MVGSKAGKTIDFMLVRLESLWAQRSHAPDEQLEFLYMIQTRGRKTEDNEFTI